MKPRNSIISFRLALPSEHPLFDTTLCDKVCQWLAACWWFYPGATVSSTK